MKRVRYLDHVVDTGNRSAASTRYGLSCRSYISTSKTTHLQKLIFERINLVCLSSFAFGIVCSCLRWGSEILEKRCLLRMAAFKFTLMHYSYAKS